MSHFKRNADWLESVYVTDRSPEMPIKWHFRGCFISLKSIHSSFIVSETAILQILFAGAKGARREVSTSSINIPPMDVKGICHAVPQ